MHELRVFFPFYGGKWRVARRYPTPLHDTIIEPFAGSAGYSLRRYWRKVILCDADPIIAGLWAYLIRVSPGEILRLPATVDHVDEIRGPQEARWLVGFWLNSAVTSPRKSLSAQRKAWVKPGSSWSEQTRLRVASHVEYIRHWTVIHGSYSEIPVPPDEATWFVDPPYQRQGIQYRCRIDRYDLLASWCRSLPGQVIVCESEGADWLPFRTFASVKAMNGKSRKGVSHEVIWTRDCT